MTPELRQFLESLVAQLKTLAEAVNTLAGNMDQPQTADKAQVVATDVRDAWVDWDSYTKERTV